MKQCPNPSCPHRLRVGSAAEFYDEIAICSDCGSTLLPAPAEDSAPAAPESTRADAGIGRRLAVTLLAPLFVLLGERIVLPGVSLGPIEDLVFGLDDGAVSGGALRNVSVFALGIVPVISASYTVEIAALIVPSWRRLRHGGPAGRAKLWRATLWLALALCVLQGLSLCRWLDATVAPGVTAWPVILTLSAGTFLLIAVTQLISRQGLTNGFSILIAAPLVLEEIGRLARRLNPDGPAPLAPLQVVVLLGAIGATVVATLLTLGVRWSAISGALQRRSVDAPIGRTDEARLSYRTAPRAEGAAHDLPCPASGVVPIVAAASLPAFASTLANLGVPLSGPLAVIYHPDWGALLNLLIVVALVVAFSVLFNQPKRVAGVRSGAGAEGAARADLHRAIRRTVAFLAGITILAEVVFRIANERPNLYTTVIVTAVVLDLLAERRARAASGELVSVWPEHRLYALDVALSALAAEGIHAHARGAAHRTMLQFGGPFVPIELMVPPDRAEDARRVLYRRLLGEDPPEEAGARDPKEEAPARGSGRRAPEATRSPEC